MDFMQPRVTKREKKLHYSYELDERIHCSTIYPLVAPNGSTIILYGHDRGLRILWRGGRIQPEAQNNGLDTVMNGDDAGLRRRHSNADDQNETSRDNFVESIDLDLEAEVLSIAVPELASLPALRIPPFATSHMLVALSDSNGRVKLLTIPIAPPQSHDHIEFIQNNVSELELAGDGSITQHLAIKVVPNDNDTGLSNEDRVLLATTQTGLNIWEARLTTDSIVVPEESSSPIRRSPVSASTVSFHPSPKSNQLLVCDKTGAVRIYDTLLHGNMNPRPSSRESTSRPATNDGNTGTWIMSYHAPFYSPNDNPALARRKKILDAAWVLSGRGILALLEDGEWGIWDVTGNSTQPGRNIDDFVVKGYLGSSSVAEVANSGKQRKSESKLAPMTPNTRKAKSENLFSGTPKAPGVASTGGITVAISTARSGPSDESIIMWYNNDVYSIPSMQSFWKRSTSDNSGNFGSLYAPGLTHIPDITLMNENITSISQFNSTSTSSSLGQMNTQRDLLVSGEHRFIILQSSRSHTPSRQLFSQAAERPALRDQRMLDAGELDLGGMDRMLNSMTGDERTRRVGFAS